jgi:hypothetical protein
MITQDNFDWSLTERQIVVFIPNYKRKNLLIPTLQRFQTELPRDQWIFLVVNDGMHEDLSDLEDYNLCYFTFVREPNKERNGCLIRNYVLRRLQCATITTRDPEIFIAGGDHLVKIDGIGDIVYRPGGMIEFTEQMTQKILDDPYISVSELDVLRRWQVTDYNYQAFHCGMAMNVDRMIAMGGYDEDFAEGYGWEDVNFLERLKLSDVRIIIDHDLMGFHIHHPRYRIFQKTIAINGSIYEKKKKNLKVVANENREWGQG